MSYNTIERDLNDIVNVEAKTYGLYTLTNRAIPHLIDGLKPVQRFFLASALSDASTKAVKIASLSGNVSKYGYAHGESSAADAGVLMGADWSNNVNIIEGRGNFGSRIITESAAPRYIYAKVHDNFNQLFGKDLMQKYEHPDNEVKIPQFYVPVIPLVLCNQTSGIATGFATTILPHSVTWIKKACKEFIKHGRVKTKPVIEFPSFKGTVEHLSDGSVIQHGVYTAQSATRLTVTEIPTNKDWNSYATHLDKLQDDRKIVRWADQTGENGFEFDVVLKNGSDAYNKDKMMKMLKLSQPFSQNINIVGPGSDITSIDTMYTLKTYTSGSEVVADFVKWKLNVSLPLRIKMMILDLKSRIEFSDAKIKFINDVNNNVLDLRVLNRKDLRTCVIREYSLSDDNANKLIGIPVYKLSKDEAQSEQYELEDLTMSLTFWEKETPESQFQTDLIQLRLT